MESTEGVPIRLGRQSPRVRWRTVLVALALLVAVLPVALLGAARMALRRKAQFPPPPEGSVRVAELAPGVEVLSVPSPFGDVVEHYIGMPGSTMEMTSADTKVPLVGTVNSVIVFPLERGQSHQGALAVSRGMGQVSWVLLFGSLQSGGTYAVSGRETAGAAEKPGAEQLHEWTDARLTDRGTVSSGPVAGGYFMTNTPLAKLWKAYGESAGAPQPYAPGLSGSNSEGLRPMFQGSRYWTGVTDEGVCFGVIEQRWEEQTVLTALMQAPGAQKVEVFVAVLGQTVASGQSPVVSGQ